MLGGFLSRFGFRLAFVSEAQGCCGSAGTYVILLADIAEPLRYCQSLELQADKPGTDCYRQHSLSAALAGKIRFAHAGIELQEKPGQWSMNSAASGGKLPLVGNGVHASLLIN